MTTPHDLSPEELEEALHVLVYAHEGDAEFGEAFSGEQAVTRGFLRALFRYALLRQGAQRLPPIGVEADGKLAGVVLYANTQLIGRLPETEERALRLAYAEQESYDPGSLSRLLDRYWIAARKLFPEKPFYRIDHLAVAPRAQGRGLGERLVEFLVARAEEDPESAGVAACTYSAARARFYQHLGFRLVAHRSVLGVDTWFLFRNRNRERMEDRG